MDHLLVLFRTSSSNHLVAQQYFRNSTRLRHAFSFKKPLTAFGNPSNFFILFIQVN